MTSEKLSRTIRIAASRAAKDVIQLPHLIEKGEPYHMFLYNLARKLKPANMLELGVKHGTGLMYMRYGWPEAQNIVGVDIQIMALPPPLKGKLNTMVIESDSIAFLKKSKEKFGLVHIDTEHTPGQVAQELHWAIRKLEVPGVICIDDVHYSMEMKSWWKKVCRRNHNRCFTFPDLHTTGFGVYIADLA